MRFSSSRNKLNLMLSRDRTSHCVQPSILFSLRNGISCKRKAFLPYRPIDQGFLYSDINIGKKIISRFHVFLSSSDDNQCLSMFALKLLFLFHLHTLLFVSPVHPAFQYWTTSRNICSAMINFSQTYTSCQNLWNFRGAIQNRPTSICHS